MKHNKRQSILFNSLPSKSDCYLIALYWVITIPIVYFSNVDHYGVQATIKGLIFTVLLDTLTVLTIIFTLPSIFIKRRYTNSSIIGFLLLVFYGGIYAVGYKMIFNENFKLNVLSLVVGMLDHARSYGILAMLISGKKFYDIRIHIERVERFKVENELKFIRSQINPHFLFNTLNNIYSLVNDNDPRASAIIDRLSHLLRYIVYESSKDYVLLKHELRFITDYFNLEKLRHDNHPAIALNITGDPSFLKIAPSILISFVENAFKHGFNKKPQDNWLKIDILIQKEILQLNVTNSKSSETERISSDSGVGILNARRHLDLQYPDNNQLEIDITESTFTVNLILELHE